MTSPPFDPSTPLGTGPAIAGAADRVRRVAGALERRFGLALVAGNAQLLDEVVQELCPTGPDAEHLATLVEVADVRQPLLRTLLGRILVGETHFLRTPEHFEAAGREAGRLLAERGDLSAWCCGCATGEEPYSLAMALLHSVGPLAPVKVLATDIHAGFIERAKEGTYLNRSVRAVPETWKKAFFDGPEGAVRPIEAVRSRVTWGHWNLLDGPYGGRSFDIVFCRNVLIYMSPRAAAWSARALSRAVRPGGLLFLGGADFLCPPPHFKVIEQGSAIYLERVPEPEVVAAEAPPPPPALTPVPPKATGERRRAPRRLPAVPQSLLPANGRQDGLALARSLSAAGLLREAEGQLRLVCSRQEPPADGLFMLARLLADTGRHAEARSICDTTLGRDPTHVPANHLMALLCEEAGEIDRAEEYLRRTLYADPDFAPGHVAAGALYRRLGMTELAVKHLSLAADLVRRRAPGHMFAGAHDVSAGWLANAADALLSSVPNGGAR